MDELKKFLYHLEEPTRCTSQYSQYNVMKLAGRHNYKVLLDGQGSDEMFAGYPYFYGYYLYELLKKGRLGSFLSFVFKCKKRIPGKRWRESLIFLLAPRSMKKKIMRNRSQYIKEDFYRRMLSKSWVFERIIDVKGLSEALHVHMEYKLEQLLKWEDRNAMAFSIETRVPFLDHKLVEYAMTLPSEDIISHCYTKYVLRKAMEDALPEEIVYRKDKVGFETPESEWLKDEKIKNLVESILNSESFEKRKYWDAEKVREMWRAHLSGKEDNSLHIWKLVFLEIWLRMFIDRTEVLPVE
jgi:asparagine synthase (glutamine-hydrolysing)